MIWVSTSSWISSTDSARFICAQCCSTHSAISRICSGVSSRLFSSALLALVTAAMILVRSNTASAPFRLIIFIPIPLFSVPPFIGRRPRIASFGRLMLLYHISPKITVASATPFEI